MTAMKCEHVQTELLNLDLDGTRRERLAAVLAHVDECETCRSAMEDFDRLREHVRRLGQMGAEPPEPAGGWAGFDARLHRRVHSRARRRPAVPLSLAAAVALAICGWSLYLGVLLAGTRSTDTSSPQVELMALTPQDVQFGVHVFTQVSEVFDHRADWVLISDRESEVGLVSGGDLKAEPIGRLGPSKDELLLLRLTVRKGRDTISKADLVIVPGQDAEFKVPSSAGSEIRYRVATDPQDSRRMQVWVDLSRPGDAGRCEATLGSELEVEPGRIRSLGEVMTSSGRYEVNVGFERARMAASGTGT